MTSTWYLESCFFFFSVCWFFFFQFTGENRTVRQSGLCEECHPKGGRRLVAGTKRRWWRAQTQKPLGAIRSWFTADTLRQQQLKSFWWHHAAMFHPPVIPKRFPRCLDVQWGLLWCPVTFTRIHEGRHDSEKLFFFFSLCLRVENKSDFMVSKAATMVNFIVTFSSLISCSPVSFFFF